MFTIRLSEENETHEHYEQLLNKCIKTYKSSHDSLQWY